METSKICTNCFESKLLTDYARRNLDKYHSRCKQCSNDIAKKKYELSRSKLQAVKFDGINKYCPTCNNYKLVDLFYKSKYACGYSNSCKECSNKRNKEYKRDGNYENNYRKVRRKTDTHFRLKNVLRCRISDALTRDISGGKVTKKHSSIKLLGCTIEEFKKHIEAQFTPKMNWDNYGTYFEIDHIIPCSYFNFEIEKHQLICFNYKNCRPLTISSNRSKRDIILPEHEYLLDEYGLN